MAMRILVQFLDQAVGVMLLRRRWPSERLPFKMWLFSLPALLALVTWGTIFYSTGTAFMTAGSSVVAVGNVVYLIRSRIIHEWPFEQ